MMWTLLIVALLVFAVLRVGGRACAHSRDRVGFCSWMEALRKRRVKVVVAAPHHYCVAAGISLLMLVLGHYSIEHHIGAWSYALLESITTAGE